LETRAVSCRAKVALLDDAFVRLSWPFDLIFQFTVPLGKLPGHLVCTTRRIAIEEGRLQGHGLTDFEFVRAHGVVHRGVTPSASGNGAIGHSLGIRGAVRSAFRAKNREIVDLAVLGMHQDDTAFPASKINRVIARTENWRGTDKAIVPWPGDGLEADLKA